MTDNGQTAQIQDSQRIGFVDWIRVVACFLVMLVHSSENFYAADSSGLAGNMSMLANEANRFWVAFYDGGVARTCVPLFIIVSAFLLVPLKPGQTMTGFYWHRAKRILPPLIIFMLAYCFLPLAWGAMTWEQSMKDLMNLPLNFPSMAGHLWFMYPLISLYIIMPVVSPWLEKASAKDELIIIGLFVLSTFMPWIRMYIQPEIWGECFWNEYHMLWYVSGFLGYLVLAHYIHYHIHWDTKRRLLIGLPCFLIGSAFTAWSYWLHGVPGKLVETPYLEWGWSFCVPNGVLATFGAFLSFSAIKGAAPKFILKLSKLSYGIYLIHLLWLAPIAAYFVNGDVTKPLLPVWLAIPTIAALTFVCSTATAWLLSWLPGAKYIVGTSHRNL